MFRLPRLAWSFLVVIRMPRHARLNAIIFDGLNNVNSWSDSLLVHALFSFYTTVLRFFPCLQRQVSYVHSWAILPFQFQCRIVIAASMSCSSPPITAAFLRIQAHLPGLLTSLPCTHIASGVATLPCSVCCHQYGDFPLYSSTLPLYLSTIGLYVSALPLNSSTHALLSSTLKASTLCCHPS